MAVKETACTQFIPKSVQLFPQEEGGQGPKSIAVACTIQLEPYRSGTKELSLSCPGVSWAAGLAISGAESPAIHWLWDEHKTLQMGVWGGYCR